MSEGNGDVCPERAWIIGCPFCGGMTKPKDGGEVGDMIFRVLSDDGKWWVCQHCGRKQLVRTVREAEQRQIRAFHRKFVKTREYMVLPRGCDYRKEVSQ